jgi:hypothetical protein
MKHFAIFMILVVCAWGQSSGAVWSLLPQPPQTVHIPTGLTCIVSGADQEACPLPPVKESSGQLHIYTWYESDPTDVPAIQEAVPGNDPLLLRDPMNCVDGWRRNALYGDICFGNKFWTCADKTRILLTAEDDTRHCVKFGK